MFNRKGISPVIATLLLIVITVAAAVVTYTFTMGFVGTTTAITGPTQVQLSYDAYSVTTRETTKSNITIYIRNTGGKAVVLNAVYVDGVAYSYEGNSPSDRKWTLRFTNGTPIPDKSLDVGALGVLVISSDKPAAQSQQVTIVCTDGTTLSLTVRK